MFRLSKIITNLIKVDKKIKQLTSRIRGYLNLNQTDIILLQK